MNSTHGPTLALLGTGSRTDLSLSRALARDGYRVIASGGARLSPLRASRAVARYVRSENSDADLNESLASLMEGGPNACLITSASLLEAVVGAPRLLPTSFRALLPPEGSWKLEPASAPIRGALRTVAILLGRQGETIGACVTEAIRWKAPRPDEALPRASDRWSVQDPELIAESLQELKRRQWCGFAELTWERDPLHSNRPRLRAISPVPGAATALAIRAGIPLATLYARAALDLPCATPIGYASGVRLRRLFYDDFSRYLAPGPEGRERPGEFLREALGTAEEWDPRDLAASLLCLISGE